MRRFETDRAISSSLNMTTHTTSKSKQRLWIRTVFTGTVTAIGLSVTYTSRILNKDYALEQCLQQQSLKPALSVTQVYNCNIIYSETKLKGESLPCEIATTESQLT